MSINFPVSQEVILNQIMPRLSNVARGFNATYNVLAPDYGVMPDMEIDFTGVLGGASKNFALANVDPGDWIDSGPYNFPLMTLFSEEIDNRNYQKFHLFSGDVVVGLNFFISWREEKLKVGVFEPKVWCSEQALLTLFNRAPNSHVEDQDWGDIVTYNGGINIKKQRLERADQFWGQAIMCKLQFQVDQRGEI